MLKALPDFTLDINGTISGKACLHAPYAKMKDTTTWIGSGEVTSGELVVEGRTAKDLHFAGEVAKGVLASKMPV